MDINGTLALIAAISAVFAPVLTALINNHHQRKMKKLEMATEQKIDKIQSYIIHVLNYVNEPNKFSYNGLNRISLEVSLYVSSSTVKEINRINSIVLSNPEEFSIDDLAVLIHKFQKDLGLT